MIQMKKVLLPTDFSECSKEASKYAVSMAGEFGAEMIVMHIINIQPITEGLNLPRVISMDELENEMEKEASRRMELFLKDVADLDRISYRKILKQGNPSAEIIAYAKEQDIDLIVIGTHGRTGVEHLLFGSTAEKVVRKAPCPVLTVKPAQHEFIA